MRTEGGRMGLSLLLAASAWACSGSSGSGPSTSGSSSGAPMSTSSSGAPTSASSSSAPTSASSGSSSGNLSDASAWDGSGPPPQAFVYAQIGPGVMSGVDDSAACGDRDLTWELGSAVSPLPVSLPAGSSQVGAAVQVSCTVDPDGSAFSVQLAAELDGLSGGTLFVSGKVGTSGSSTGLSASFTTQGQTFIAMDSCTFSLTYNGAPLPAGGEPAAGRVWGHIDCPLAADNGQEGLGEDGSVITRTCDASADFLFENCQ